MRMRARYVTVQVATGRGVAERWKAQYLDQAERTEWPDTVNGNSGDIYKRLCALGPNPDIDAVADVIGNKNWSYVTCDGCGDDVKRAVAIGSTCSGKSYCETCVKEAAFALSQTEG